MINKLFPKVTEIEGGAASVTTPKFRLDHSGAVVFLVGASDTPLTITAKGYKGEDDAEGKAIDFNHKGLQEVKWDLVGSGGKTIEDSPAFLIGIPHDFLAHDELDRVTLTIAAESGSVTPTAIFAFEVISRYIPE